MTPFDLVHLNLALDLIRPGQTSLVLVGSWLVPAKSADVSQTVEDSEHSETQTRDPQHTGALNPEDRRAVIMNGHRFLL